MLLGCGGEGRGLRSRHKRVGAPGGGAAGWEKVGEFKGYVGDHWDVWRGRGEHEVQGCAEWPGDWWGSQEMETPESEVFAMMLLAGTS